MPVEKVGKYDFNDPIVAANVNLLEPRAFVKNGKPSGDPKYGATLVFNPDSEELVAAKAVAAAVAKVAFPGVPMAKIKFPFRNGDKENEKRGKRKNPKTGEFYAPLEWQAGKVTLPARNKEQPRLGAVVNGRVVDLETDAQVKANARAFYNGVEVCASVNFSAYGDAANLDDPDADAITKPGVAVYLNNVLSTGKGARIGGGRSSSEVFKGYAGRISSVDPTKGAAPADEDDEIPY